MAESVAMAKVGDRDAGAFLALNTAKNAVERAVAAKRALQLVVVPEAQRPVPRFMLDLPWSQSSEEIVDAILESLIAAPDLIAATDDKGAAKAEDLVGKIMELHDVRVMPSDVEDARWGAYLLLDMTLTGGTPVPVSSGAAEVVVTAWRLYCAKLLPARVRFALLGNPTPGRNQPVGLVVLATNTDK